MRGAWTMPILVFGLNAIAGFVADSFVYGPGYSWAIKGANGAAVLWHDAAQARLVALVGNPAVAALMFALASVSVLLEPALAALARENLSQGLIQDLAVLSSTQVPKEDPCQEPYAGN